MNKSNAQDQIVQDTQPGIIDNFVPVASVAERPQVTTQVRFLPGKVLHVVQSREFRFAGYRRSYLLRPHAARLTFYEN